MTRRSPAFWRDSVVWITLIFVTLVMAMPFFKPLFAMLFPWLKRPFYEQDTFLALTIAHLILVGASSMTAAALGIAAGIFVTRPMGADFRNVVETMATIGQTFPPVAVLAVAVPLIGFGFEPAFIALVLYSLLPIIENTIAGLGAVPAAVRESARGMGMGDGDILRRVELPLAMPLIIAGVRTSTIINVGTAAIASTVGAKTLGLPIIIGLNASNIAYIMQGAIVVGFLAVVIDLVFERLASRIQRWQA